MKKLKGIIIGVLLIVLSMTILLSGCAPKSETLEDINKKFDKEIDGILRAYNTKEYLDHLIEIGSVIPEYDKLLELGYNYCISKNYTQNYDRIDKMQEMGYYIVSAINYKSYDDPKTGDSKKNMIYTCLSPIRRYGRDYIQKDNVSWVKIAILTNEQKDEVIKNIQPDIEDPDEYGNKYFFQTEGGSVWKKAEKLSDIVIKWNL